MVVEHVGHGSAVFPFQVVDNVHPFLKPGQAFRLEFDVLPVITEIGGDVFKLIESVADDFDSGGETGVETGGRLQFLTDVGKVGQNAPRSPGAFGEESIGPAYGAGNLFGIAEEADVLGELFFLVCAQGGGGDLAGLPGQHVDTLGAFPRIGLGAGQGGAELAPGGVETAVTFEPLPAGGRQEGVDHRHLGLGPQQGLMFMLAVQVDEFGAELAQYADGYVAAVVKDGVLALAGKVAAEDEGPVFERYALVVQDGAYAGIGGDVEDGLDPEGFAAAADGVAVGPTSQQGTQGVDENGFAGAGFAGENVEPAGKFDARMFDEGEIGDGQRFQHRGSSLRRPSDKGAELGEHVAGRLGRLYDDDDGIVAAHGADYLRPLDAVDRVGDRLGQARHRSYHNDVQAVVNADDRILESPFEP